jgi:hypothetical protein
MKKMSLLVLIPFLLFVLAACQPSPEQQAAAVATALTATASSWTETPLPTNTPLPSSTPKATLTPTPSPTDTPTQVPTATATPAPTQDPRRYYSNDGLFSLVIEDGWEEQDLGLKYPALVLEISNDFASTLLFVTEDAPYYLEDYSDMMKVTMLSVYTGIEELSEEYLTTDAGMKYYRWEYTNLFNDVDARQVLYVFENGDLKLIGTYTRLNSPNPELDEQVEAALNTLRFER